MQIQLQNTQLNLIPDNTHEFLLPNKDVALGYGIDTVTISRHKSNQSDELIEGKHWLRLEVQTNGGKQKVIHWTKKGIVRLGFFIKSKKAKEFRDWAEDYIVEDKKQLQQIDPTVEKLTHNINKLLEENEKLHCMLEQKPSQSYETLLKRVKEQEAFYATFSNIATKFADELHEKAEQYLYEAVKVKVEYNETKTKIWI